MGGRDAAVAGIIRRCHTRRDSSSLLQHFATGLTRIVPFAAGYFGTTDPSTLLLTSGILFEHGPDDIPRFVANEYLDADVMKFRDLATGHDHVDWLRRATKGEPDRSPRYRNLFTAAGMGDELRAAFVVGGTCWGVMCITREAGAPHFTAADAAVVSRLASHVADGLRTSMLLTMATDAEPDPNGPGVLVIDRGLKIVAATATAQRWLSEVTGSTSGLPFAACSAVATLQALDPPMVRAGVQPRVRVRARSGRWLVIHAAHLSDDPEGPIAVVIEPAGTGDTTPLVLQAYALSPKELEVTRRVILGRSTRQIAAELCISEHTVKDHLKSIFDKAGVSSRRQLVAQVLSDNHR